MWPLERKAYTRIGSGIRSPAFSWNVHGVTVRDVAELLGNTEQMVRKHYSAWIPERQGRLTAVLKAAFGEKPKPNVIEMPKTGTN